MACFFRLPSAFLRAWDRHRSQSFSAGHSGRIRVITHAADLAPRTLSSCTLSLTACFHVDVSTPAICLLCHFACLRPSLWLGMPFAWWYTYHLTFPCTCGRWGIRTPDVLRSLENTVHITVAKHSPYPVCFQPDSANLPCPVCRDTIAAASYHHTSRLGYSSLSEIWHRPTVYRALHH